VRSKYGEMYAVFMTKHWAYYWEQL